MRIKCPICGERDHREFAYWGDASIVYPPLGASEDEWYSAVHERANPAGEHEEIWHHESGCRSFLKVTRNTVTHEISDVVLMGSFSEKVKADE